MRFKRSAISNPRYITSNLREYRRFAWLPITIGLETRWLEHIVTQQKRTNIGVDTWTDVIFKI